MKFSIIIPNWNGKKLLAKNLPAVLTAAGKKAEVIVVDNGSTDGSVEFLKNLAQEDKNSIMRIIEVSENRGFAYACNLGVEKAKGELVVLLNNDVMPEKNFLEPLEQDFADPEVFAVSLNEPQWSWAKGIWRKGFIEHQPGKKTKSHHISFWANGGSGAFRKKIWGQLGGFDELHHPFYWEDIDLSYRAWKRGYKIIWEPRSIVHHKHEGTISRFPKKYVGMISQRNQLLFIWKNITDPKMIWQHKFWLGKRLLTTPGYWRPFLTALVRLPKILPRRLKERQEQEVSDEKIFAQFN